MNFCHLHCHDEYSLLDGFGSPAAYANKAKEIGFEYLAITNHGNVDGLVKFQNACSEAGVRAIHGCELYVVKDIHEHIKGEKRAHLTVLVKNAKGWQNLLKMLTKAGTDGFYYRPRLDPEIILEHQEGLLFMSACTSSLVLEEWGLKLFLDIKEDKFLEVMPHNYKPQKQLNALCSELSAKYGIPLVATNDCHYISKGDEKCQEVLLAIQSKKKWKDPERWKFDISGLYLKTREEMIASFRKQKVLSPKQIVSSLNNTGVIAEMCKNFSIDHLEVELPAVPGIEEDDKAAIRRLCEEGFKNKITPKIKKKDIQIYRDRLEEELEIIIKQGFSRYFLIIWELMKWCSDNDIMVGPGRGSSGGSLVAYLLGIVQVDPIKYKLVFARFISPARIDLPDIDMDFEDRKRELVIKHFKDIYGEYNVCGVSTFMTSKGRGALRDVARVFDVPMADVGPAASCIVVRSGGDVRSDYSLTDAFSTFEDGIKFKKKYPEVTDLAIRIEGQTRGKGQHAAAVVISAEDLREGKRTALQRGKTGIMSNWDKYDIEHFGLMKLDILGLNNLTVLTETKRLIKENKGADVVFEDIDLEDEKLYVEFSNGNNIGCFQVGSLGLRRFCQQLGVENFDMLVHATSLYRPGTLRSGMTTEFVMRKKGEKKYASVHPILDDITKDTYGIILYQEQVMRFMYDLGGLGWKTADTVRKVISKSQGVEQFQKFKKMFADGCVERKTLDRQTAERLWDELASFGSYGFNLSHAVEYSIITVWDMWCKIYYPVEFMCANLTYGSDAKKEEIIEEAIRLGIDVRPPKKGISDSHKWVVKDNILYAPFIEIKGIGEKTAESVMKASQNGFYKKEGKKINKKFEAILLDIKYDKDEQLSEEDAEYISKYFQFSFSRDKYRKVRKVLQRIQEGIQFSNIGDINFNIIDKEYKNYFGRMTEIKFGYRAKLDSLEKKLTIAGQSDNLGGVYGNFVDKTDFCMLVFGSDLYKRKKETVEHCSDSFLLVKGNVPSRAGSIQCADAWFEEEIMTGDLEGLNLNLAKERRFRNKELQNCESCELRLQCTKPVMPSTGLYNIMIIGEAPGKDEDRLGYGFSGRAGDVLWNTMKKFGYGRRTFNITNVVKCFPSETKTPGAKHIKACSRWIDEEIEKINPFLILSFGNTGLKYFLGEEGSKGGIMTKSGTTQWLDKFNAWVCWCLHPAAVLYHQENSVLFEKGIENFARKIEILG